MDLTCPHLSMKFLYACRRVADVVHYDLLDALHQQNKSADDVSLQAGEGGKPAFSSAMLAKVHTIIPMVWR